MYLIIVPSTDIQNWHDYNALQLHESTAQYEGIDMSHYKKVVSADSSCSVVWLGASAACAEVSTGSVEASKAKHCNKGLHVLPGSIY
jgi:hypothetical protein